MKRLIPLALCALALPAGAATKWTFSGQATGTLTSDDETPTVIKDVRVSDWTARTITIFNHNTNPLANGDVDLSLPIEDASGNVWTLVAIARQAFQNNSDLTSIKVPASVKNIDYFAFLNCPNLESFELEEGTKLSSLGMQVFNGCSSLKTPVAVPRAVKEIGTYLVTNTKVPSFSALGATNIASKALQSVSTLKAVEFGDAIETLGTELMSGCPLLAQIRWHDKVPSSFGDMLTVNGRIPASCAFYIPYDAENDTASAAWLAFQATWTAAENTFTLPSRAENGAWTDGSIAVKGKTAHPVRYWRPGATSALFAD